jgi:DNA polymerase (family 10)
MKNNDIARKLKLTAALLEVHGDNPFKIRTYSNAVFKVENLSEELAGKSQGELEAIDGVGKGLATSISQMLDTGGTFDLLSELKTNTPAGVLEMIDLKGLGPKKIRTIWKTLDIQTLEALYEACQKGEIANLKGFGAKTQDSLKENLSFLMANRGRLRYADAEPYVDVLVELLSQSYPNIRISPTGDFRRKTETIETIEALVASESTNHAIVAFEASEQFNLSHENSGPFTLRGKFTNLDVKWVVRFTSDAHFEGKLIRFTGSGQHLSSVAKTDGSLHQYLLNHPETSEKEAYAAFNLPVVAPELREGTLEATPGYSETELVKTEDLRGVLHNHSKYSDGNNTIREMAQSCIDRGYEYFGLTDHSQSAFYAGGLTEFDIKKQHQEIDQLNIELSPFRIFKGIESDILADGSLDYEPQTLESFDFIVASVHSGLSMDINKATNRLIKAIENPHTTMLGHPTGRLLLKRAGYPIDHKKVIDACAKNDVIIEINANPWRLDLDWRWVQYAMEKKVMLSINPDAHEVAGIDDMKYGVYVGRKGGLKKSMTFNALGVDDVRRHFEKRKTGAKGKMA